MGALDFAAMDALGRFQAVALIAAALLFILALAGLAKQRSAAAGNTSGMVGMALALVATVVAAAAGAVDGPVAVGLMVGALLALALVDVQGVGDPQPGPDDPEYLYHLLHLF